MSRVYFCYIYVFFALTSVFDCVCMSVCVSLSPGSGVQICAKLSWWAGSSGLAHRCAERTRGREGERPRLPLLVYNLPRRLLITVYIYVALQKRE